ncbi:uncharacterized protein LOC118441591 [Vespa mandarinia]|uniref:uncharacterized protein LOC118441591 n=1 Tax=Vespa mandarinia TaxID=7446 RepID=UPI001612F485|nr:uncharacterized protein LOC118441591 [Vespa mandarinia]XP_035722093.1 uncharacterized protein LOC118441591 [Vespa mandarinia]
MSWFFGKKKHQKESPVESTEDLTSTSIENEFENIERQMYPVPQNSQDGIPYPGGGLYPVINDASTYPTLPTNSTKQNQQGDMQHYLSGVPFKLCKQLESNMNDFEIDRLRANEILSFIQRIEEQNLDYDFSHEKSVITEMNSTNDE